MRKHWPKLRPNRATAKQIGYERVYNVWTWAVVDKAYSQAEAKKVDGREPVAPDVPAVSDFRVEITLRADPLTCIMLSMVTFISTLVVIYASGYMHGDPGYWRFFTYVSLFVFSMTMLVSVSNFVLLYVFWEAVGLCSYLLVGFWYEKPEAVAAGKKAIVGQSHWRLWLRAGRVPDLDDVRHAQLPRHASTPTARWPWPACWARRGWQIRHCMRSAAAWR